MEIEAKFALDAAETARLRALLGAPTRSGPQRDVYLATAGLPVALRVRQDGDKACVTLKAGFEKVAGIRVREEWEPAIEPEQLDTWLTVFTRLGFPPGEVVEKHRDSWELPNGVHVVIDLISGLGSYCEVEAVADERDATLARLEATIARLGLAGHPRITRSYRDLLRDARVSGTLV
ncbi:MAG: class IV adenylate cyclase [Candidatus Sericytochromatia bacterium]|nr:class IV adenylate cyclase [Candidatus Sericytochromatia bacterium]